MFGIGELLTPMHLVFVMAVALLIFGPQRLPEIGRSLGKGIHEFRNAGAESKNDKSVNAAEADKLNR